MKSKKQLSCLFWLLSPILLLIFCCLASYIYIEIQADSYRKEQQNIPVTTLFDTLICAPPCWNQIEPGVSTREQVLDLKYQFTENTFSFGTAYEDTHYIFNLKNPATDYSGTVRFVMDDNGLVKVIGFDVYLSHRMPLWYVLKSLGEPEYAVANGYSHPSGDMLILYYPAKGIEVRCLPGALMEVWMISVGSVDCESESNTDVLFYPPEDYQARLAIEYGSSEKAQNAQRFFCPWVGIEGDYLYVNLNRHANTPTEMAIPNDHEEIAKLCPLEKPVGK